MTTPQTDSSTFAEPAGPAHAPPSPPDQTGDRRPGRRGLLRAVRQKNWDQHVGDMEAMADTAGFLALRERIVGLADLSAGERVLDVGSGTGLLALAVAPSVEQVYAIDISAAMCRRLAAKVLDARLTNVEIRQASASRLPLPDESVDVVLSNYCYHHLEDRDKELALAEARRVMRPGGRLVIGDMMFRVRVTDARDRAVMTSIVKSMLRRGPAGLLRVLKNAARYVTGRWEHPADVDWWRAALSRAGFIDVEVHPLDHEGGIAVARRAGPGPS